MRAQATALAILIVLLASSLAAADPIPADEATLNGASLLYEVKRDSSGNAYITDWGVQGGTQGTVWRVSPAGAYTRYSGFGATITNTNDATPDSAGNIWFTDSTNPILARINTAANPVTLTRWDLSKWDASRTYALGGLTFDPAGRLWFSEQGEGSSTQLLYRLDLAATPPRLCGYTIPDGNHSFYVVYNYGAVDNTGIKKDTLWLGDWALNRIVRVVPPANETAAQVTYWDTATIGEPRGLAVDSSTGYVWWAVRDATKLMRLDPLATNNNLMTFALPVVAAPSMVSIDGTKLWYTAEGTENSNIGNVLLSTTSTNTSKKSPAGPTGYTPTCRPLAPEQPDLQITVTPPGSTLTWRNETFADVTPAGATGWQIYEVKYGGVPFGIDASASRVWATDQLFGQLIRINFGGLAAPVVTISIPAGTTNVVLAWGASSGATAYYTWYSSTDPYFTPGGTPAPDPNDTDLTFTHTGAAGNLSPNYYYVVHAVGSGGESSDSNRTGKFSFTLTPGG
jgi:sugar lactone lactonase YvrE